MMSLAREECPVYTRTLRYINRLPGRPCWTFFQGSNSLCTFTTLLPQHSQTLGAVSFRDLTLIHQYYTVSNTSMPDPSLLDTPPSLDITTLDFDTTSLDFTNRDSPTVGSTHKYHGPPLSVVVQALQRPVSLLHPERVATILDQLSCFLTRTRYRTNHIEHT
jgi:hypothetical protein